VSTAATTDAILGQPQAVGGAAEGCSKRKRATITANAMFELGCVREGVLRKHFFPLDDHLRDTALFSINDSGRHAVCRDPGATCVRRRRH